MNSALAADSGNASGVLLGFFIFMFLLFAYFIPAIVAFGREHHNKGGILALNLFLGKSRGVSRPAPKFAAMGKNGSACGIVIALLHDAWANLLNADSYPQVGPNTGMVGWP